MQSIGNRLTKHARLNWQNISSDVKSPPFLILFINSICNMKCEHCFYWKELNQSNDLTFAEIKALSEDLGPIENLNLSGGEPFIRPDFAEVCRQFIRQNGVKEIYCPTNGYFTDRTIAALREVLKEPDLKMFGVEISLDGMPDFHDEFRKAPNAFRKAMETYDALARLQEEDPRLHIHSISTATERNMDEIRQLTTYLYERCPKMAHHNLAIIRGDRKNPTLQGPVLAAYEDLYEYVRRLWAPRERGRYGGMVEPMLQHAKVETAKRHTQYVPCRAGVMTGVVYANGDVAVCEQRDPIGNLRDKSFMELWRSHHAGEVRESIACKECFCTNEIFMWSSIVYQPTQLVKSMIGGRVWERPVPLREDERASYSEAAKSLDGPLKKRPLARAAKAIEARD